MICKLFGHKYRWIIAYEEIWCIRCKHILHSSIAEYRYKITTGEILKSI